MLLGSAALGFSAVGAVLTWPLLLGWALWGKFSKRAGPSRTGPPSFPLDRDEFRFPATELLGLELFAPASTNRGPPACRCAEKTSFRFSAEPPTTIYVRPGYNRVLAEQLRRLKLKAR